MKLELDSLMEEVIANNLSGNGISDELIDKCIEDIKHDIKETNYLHNSVADSNFYAAEVRKENDLIKQLKEENERLQRSFQKDYDDMVRDKNYRMRRLEEEIERLSK